jgi:hypothetical protein
MLKLEIKNLDKVTQEISNAINKFVEPKIDEKIKTLVYELKEATPKDTGYAASRWTAEKSKTSVSLVKTTITFKDKEYVISNDANYISDLNEGISTQAPARFIEQTVLNQGFKPTGSIVTRKS